MDTEVLDRPFVLLDGGLGTTLEDEHGIKFSSATPLWSSHLLIENTSTLKAVQQDFAGAGADIILTATYQASFDGFRNTNLTGRDGIDRDEATQYMLSSVQIARDAFDGRHGLVALSLGAYGATMIPGTEYSGEYGDMTEQSLQQFHQERLSCFQESPMWKEIDIIAVETLPRLDEVRAAKAVLQTIHDKPYWISCVFPNDDERLPDGTTIEELVKTLVPGEQQLYAIGINCTKAHKVPGLIRGFEESARRQNMELPGLVIYPDGAGGKVYNTSLQQWIGSDEDQPAWDQQVFDIVKDVHARGRWRRIVVGGCCKTTPQHIKRLRARLQELDTTNANAMDR